MYRMLAHKTRTAPDGSYYYYCRECPKGERPFIWCDDADAAVNDAVMAMADQQHIITSVTPGDTYAEEINQIKKEINAIDPEADDWLARVSPLREEIRRLRKMPRKAAKMETKPDDKTVGEVW